MKLDWLNWMFWNNRLADYLVFIAILMLGWLGLTVFKRFILWYLKRIVARTQTTLDDLLVALLDKSFRPLLFLGVFFLALQTLHLSLPVARGFQAAIQILLAWLAARLLTRLLEHSFSAFWLRRQHDLAKNKSLAGMLSILKGIIWIFAGIFLFDNLGFNVAAILAGFGIGGIAVGLAAQSVLGDVFSYFAIVIDRPFDVGDFIVIKDLMGTVEAIGVKTTRIRSLGGEQIIIANSELTRSSLRNFKRMERRRVTLNFGVVYQTPQEMLNRIPEVIRSLLGEIPLATFDRAHFSAFQESALGFEAIYYVESGDYNRFMDIQQRLHLRMNEEFKRLGIEFAYPTQTVYLNDPTVARSRHLGRQLKQESIRWESKDCS